MRSVRLLLPAATLLLAGCFEEAAPVRQACNSCHGAAANDAPPLALGDFTDTGYRGVGAHQAHLALNTLGKAVECSACHVVPATIDALGHIDTAWPAEVAFGGLALTGSVAPTWTWGTMTCSNVYCHGATLGGGANKVQVWTTVDGSQKQCGSCHATPPPAPHPGNMDCAQCHAPTAGANLTIANQETHVDGQVQLSMNPCGGCHGDGESLAPPPDSMGRSDTSLSSVGAHRAHSSGGRFSAAVACTDCHVVPAAVGDAGHIDTGTVSGGADVIFAGVATTRGATPTYNSGASTCATTWCHATASSGGTVDTPIWTTVDGSQSACGTCHGLPPTLGHPQAGNCEGCHGSVAGPNLTILDPSKHVDGIVQF